MTIPGIKIFKAKKVITMNSYCPYGTHVAVKEGKILGVGSLEQLEGWGGYELDETFNENFDARICRGKLSCSNCMI